MEINFVTVKYGDKKEKEIFDVIDDKYLQEKERIKKILELVKAPFTAIIEDTYVCKLYRDSYYRYYASQFEEKDKYCVRITIISGLLEQERYFDKEYDKIVNENVVGFIILRPLATGNIGRTVLNPQKLKIPECYIRTTKYKFMVWGRRLEVEGFGFVSQDSETMTCSECCIYSLAEYYGTQYNEYKMVLPSEILKYMSLQSFERVLPSKGVQKEQITRMLFELGFEPKLYSSEEWEIGENEENEKEQIKYLFDESIKRTLYYYIESGIPTIVSLEIPGNDISEKETFHAIICIGHIKEKKVENQKIIEKNGISYINTADLVNNFIVMDDNEVPYSIKDFSKLRINAISVPLYKRIFMEATDAEALFSEIMAHNEYGIKKSINQVLDGNPLWIRIFLTSSRSYKSFRCSTINNPELRLAYGCLELPKFVWVCEISNEKTYENGKAFAEIILDATASTAVGIASMIMLNYNGVIGWKNHNETIDNIIKRMQKKIENFEPFFAYKGNNLIKIGENKDDIYNDD